MGTLEIEGLEADDASKACAILEDAALTGLSTPVAERFSTVATIVSAPLLSREARYLSFEETYRA